MRKTIIAITIKTSKEDNPTEDNPNMFITGSGTWGSIR